MDGVKEEIKKASRYRARLFEKEKITWQQSHSRHLRR